MTSLLKVRLDPTVPKVLLIAVLLFSEAIAINAYSILQQGRWPSSLELATFFMGAFIQLVTFLLTFVESGSIVAPQNEPSKTSP